MRHINILISKPLREICLIFINLTFLLQAKYILVVIILDYLFFLFLFLKFYA